MSAQRLKVTDQPRGIWATGKFWWQIPRIVSVSLEGKLSTGVTGKDVIVALAGLFNKDEVLNAAIEFVGSGIEHIPIDERLTIANMTTEWGAVAGVFPVDERLRHWYEDLIDKSSHQASPHVRNPTAKQNFSDPCAQLPHPRLTLSRLQDTTSISDAPDPGSAYASRLTLDLSTLVPYVSGPNSVKIANPLPKLLDPPIAINKAYLVSCTNSRASDIAAAANVIRGKAVAPGVEFYVAAASSRVQTDAEAAGDWQALIDAGAKPLPAGCGPCIGLGVGLLEKGQVGISATNRNYKGRMGHPEAIAYLASPAVVAASAVKGVICGPDSMDIDSLPPFELPRITFEDLVGASSTSKDIVLESLLPGFPETFRGPLVFAPQDNLTTDGMYPGKYTYQDDITPERQAEVVMGKNPLRLDFADDAENYDPSFASTVRQLRSSSSTKPVQGSGVVLISGYNFGTGSSREQAATAIKHAGIPVVICGSFGDIFKRNAINNGLILIEAPELVEDLTTKFAKNKTRGLGGQNGELTVVPENWAVTVDTRRGRVLITMGQDGEKEYAAARVGRSVQELWIHGGLEGYIRASL